MASGTGLWNLHTQEWDEPILRTLNLDVRAFSALANDPTGPSSSDDQPTPSVELTGTQLREPYASRWPALRRAQWLPAIGDGAASNVGAGCTTRQRMALMVGTSGAMRVLWRTDQVAIPWGLWGYRLDAERLVLGGALNDGGSLYAWLRETLRLPDPEPAEVELAAMEPDAHGLTILPMWAGERSPGWADDARGAIVGMRLDTTPAEILRAALEAVALRFVAIAAILRHTIPQTTEIVATGGALLRSPTWMQIMADALGCPVEESAEPEASLRGTAFVALASVLGAEVDLDQLTPNISHTYEPNPVHTERYRAAAARQERLYRLLVGEPAARP
jgi:gluconokinase